MSKFLSILAMQTTSIDSENNLECFELELTDLLADFQHTSMVIYPEFHLCRTSGTPKQRKEQYRSMAEPLDSKKVKRLGEIAKKLGIWLLPGTICEKGEGDSMYNTAIVFSPEGNLVAAYRKCFPWRPYEPHTPGGQFVTFDIPDIGRIGLAICYDIWFPEAVRELAWLGADVIINQVQTSTCDREQEHILVRANAIANQVYIVSVNAAKPAGVGRSLIVDPEGNIRTQSLSGGTDYITDVLNLDEVARVREYGTAGLNRLWKQVREDDPEISLSVYEGKINPKLWSKNTL